MHGTTGPSWLGVSSDGAEERSAFPHGHRSDLAEFEPKRSDRTQSTRAPEEETRRYVEIAEHFWVIVKKESNSFSSLVLWCSVVLLAEISFSHEDFRRVVRGVRGEALK
jgi:hypothetical protein